MSGSDALSDPTISRKIEEISEKLREARAEVGKFILGQDEVLDLTFTSLMAGGNSLYVAVPGTGKTELIKCLSTVFGMEAKRVQFTPDLMPADITGSEVMEEDENGQKHFRFIQGPVFCNFLLADEINRANPRTQSALLQAMQEKEVTVGNKTYTLPKPFHVLATQNPIEQEGTYPLPEAQIDRFLMQITLDFPSAEAEKHIALMTTTQPLELAFNDAAQAEFVEKQKPRTIFSPKELVQVQNIVRGLPIGDDVMDSIIRLTRSTRPDMDVAAENREVENGVGTRAQQAFMLATRARALLDGRMTPSKDDIAALAHPILEPRIGLSFAARSDGLTKKQFVEKLTARI